MPSREKIVKRMTKNKKAIKTGPKGGKYYLSDNGNKVYVTSSKAGIGY